MTDSFKIVFRLHVNHSFYEDNVCRELLYRPSHGTEKLMDRFSLRLNNTVDGFSFATDTKEELTAFLDYIEKVMGVAYFEFEAVTTNPNFYLFTALPINKLGYLSYDSSLTSKDSVQGQLLLEPQFMSGETLGTLFKLKIRFKDITH